MAASAPPAGFGTGQRVRFWGGEGFVKSVNEYNEATVLKDDGKEVKVKVAELERVHSQNVTRTVTVTTSTSTTTVTKPTFDKPSGAQLASSIADVKLKKTPQ